jgi:hypothetical protein
MMTVYQLYDNDIHGDHGRYYRNLAEAKADFAGVVAGRIDRIVIPTPA